MKAFQNTVKEGVLYPWEGEWEIEWEEPCIKVRTCLIADHENNDNCAQLHGNVCQKKRQVLRLLPKSPVIAKGDKGGECNRTVCHTTDAQWYNHSTQKYYCTACAGLINEANYADAIRMYGHELCTTWAQEGDIVTVSGQLKLKPVTNPGGIVAIGVPETCASISVKITAEHWGSLLKRKEVATGGIPEHPQNYICLHCKQVYGYEPDSCAECNCKTFHKTDAGISEQDETENMSKFSHSTIGSVHWARTVLSVITRTGEFMSDHPDGMPEPEIIKEWGIAIMERAKEVLEYVESRAPVNDAVGGKDFTEEDWQRLIDEHSNEPQNSTNRDWYWYLRGMREGYGQAEFEGHKRGSQPSPQAERQDDVLLSWLEEERNILQNSVTLMWHDMETRGRAKHVAQCITTTLDYIRESKTRKP